MIYKKLSPVETNEWIRLLEDTIEKAEKLSKFWYDTERFIEDEFERKYVKHWFWQWFYDKKRDVFISWSGNICYMGSFRTFNSIMDLDIWHVRAMYFVTEWEDPNGSSDKKKMFSVLTSSGKLKDMYNNLYRAWNVYADKPFNIAESDIGYYNEIESTNKRITKILKNLGLDE